MEQDGESESHTTRVQPLYSAHHLIEIRTGRQLTEHGDIGERDRHVEKEPFDQSIFMVWPIFASVASPRYGSIAA